MKLQKKILAVAIAAGFAGMAVQAQAGTASATYNTYAVEGVSALTEVPVPAIAYQTGIVIAKTTTFTLFVKLDNGAKFVSNYEKGDIKIDGQAAGANQFSVDSITASTDKTVLAIQITAARDYPANVIISLNDANNTATNPPTTNIDMSGVTAAAGTNVGASYAIVNGAAPSTVAFPTTGIVDSASNTIATFAEALKGTFVASNAFTSDFVGAVTETKKINVAEMAKEFTFGGSNTISNNVVNLGGFYLKQTDGLQDKSSTFDLKSDKDSSKLTFEITGNFAADGAAQKTKVGVYRDKACTERVFVDETSVSADGKAVISLNTPSAAADAKVQANTAYYICYTVPDNTSSAESVTIPETLPKVTAIKLYGGTDAHPSTVIKTFADANLYELKLNGDSAQLINYVPAAAAPYQTYVRIANNGSVDVTAVQVSFIGADGTTLGTGNLGAMAKGASKTFTPAELEAAAGVTLAAGDRPQIMFYATTDALDVQAYMSDVNGGFTNLTFNK